MEENTKYIYFDMDGTIADLYGIDNWMDKLHNEDSSPYIKAQPIYDEIQINSILDKLHNNGFQIIVISWSALNGSAAYNKRVRAAKVHWLNKHNFPADKVHVVKYGTPKHEIAKKYSPYGILVDDNMEVRAEWNIGHTIDASKNILPELEKLAAMV